MRTENISHRQDGRSVELPASSDAGTASPATLPRLMNRKEASRYMGRCVKTFDEIRHLFATEDQGLIRYDRVLMDRYVDIYAFRFAVIFICSEKVG